MVTEEDRQTFAMALIAKFGDGVEVHVAERLGYHVAVDDSGGVAFWQDIAAKVDAVLRAAG